VDGRARRGARPAGAPRGLPEGTGLGACLLGLHALGRFELDDAAAVVGVHDVVQPDPDAAAAYRRSRPLVARATAALTDVLAELDALP
jgi:gluconokinase